MPSKREIREKFDEIAPWYDLLEGVPEVLGLNRLRRRLLARASGKTLELAAGTGRNLRYYPQGAELTLTDLSWGMLEVARKKTRSRRLQASFAIADAERLPFPDGCFDTVVDTLALCTYPEPLRALEEIARVCRPSGSLLLLEHGRSDWSWLGRFQDRRSDRHAERFGCHWNREPLDLVRQAGLRVVAARRLFLGIFHVIEAVPPAPSSI